MNTLMTLDPWRFLDEVLNTGRKAFTRIRARAAGRFPPVNVYLDDDAVIIDLELPGKTAKDVELSLEPQAIVIAGVREVEKVGGGGEIKTDTTDVQPSTFNLFGAAAWSSPSASMRTRRTPSSRTESSASNFPRPKRPE